MHENRIAKIAVHSALNVHRQLGPGLLESTYQACLAYELKKLGLQTEEEAPMPVVYDEVKLDCGYRVDLWIERKVILELKAVQELNDVHMAQILTYLKLSDTKLGLLINFNVSKSSMAYEELSITSNLCALRVPCGFVIQAMGTKC